MATAEPPRPPRRFEPWPWALAAGLATMIATSLCLWVIASANPDGVVGDAWEAGLRYNDRLAERRAADALGADMEILSEPTVRGANLAVRLAGAPAESVVVERIRPAESGYDQEFALSLEGDAWRGHVPLPRPGRWRFQVRAQIQGARLQRRLDYWHPAAKALR